MKVSKLLVLGVLASSLCMAGSALGQGCLANLSDSLGPTGGTYDIGDTIEYVISISVPASGGGTPNCTLTNVSIYFFPPPGAAGSPCDETGSGVLIASGLTLVPGAAPYEYDSSDNAALAYLVTAADCADPTPLSASMATTFNIPGVITLQCDEKEVENTVNPVDAPVCDISGPTTVCEGAEEVEYTTSAIADTYSWSVSGDAVTVGPTNGTSVLVSPTSAAGFTVELEVCNNNGDGGCCNTCSLPVTVTEAPDCLITGPDSICEDDTEVEFCGPVGADTYYWTISGDGEIVGGINDQQCVDVNPTGDGSFTLTLAVCYTDPLCCDGCEKTVDVVAIPTPPEGEGLINSGPTTVCENATGLVYCSTAVADRYSWGITGNGTIVGPTDESCVTVDAGLVGSFTLTLEVCNESGDPLSEADDCCASGELEVTIEECGVFCTFTQGAWGNAGGKDCGDRTTTELLVDLLDAADASSVGTDPVIVGVLGVRSIKFDTANSILLRLPAGGTPSALPDGLGDVLATNQAALEAAKLLKKKGDTINNVLVGQVVTLTLNLRVNGLDLDCRDDVGDLSGWGLPEEFCTIGEDGCPEHFTIPESLWGDTVASLLADANKILAGQAPVSGASIGDIYNAVTAINEGFDECRETISCPTVEDCATDCDDDGDGLVNCDDPDCVCI